MFITTKYILAAGALALCSSAVVAQKAAPAAGAYGFGAAVPATELDQFFSPLPDGRGLPPGSGTVAQGEKVYAQQCVACHGVNLEGGLGDRLVGGRGSLPASAGTTHVKTVESYWPYATTIFDYVKRAMPFTSPNSMANDDVYAVTAYILFKANIVGADAIMNQDTLAKVAMPNRNGFQPAGR